ncbi:hypothetical protein [Levilactobacillus suantsaii]|uniref:XRE family transcriptional regulator n=1 Tax=Levilactobacillus suantsaii TaxID=2292255 RepID=A0A4Q0VJ54_9LACO|nr:hypothetical protein [Levilactobacillus suantsaii]QMU07702.1 hypothetical protein H3M12_09560 [Levilactobacillus suantsaii]RXI78682.1 hypothetical protein DXH47_06355 [Levilactobacillus suantsaii]
MKTREKVTRVLAVAGQDPYQLAAATQIPVALINNLLWHNLPVGQLTLAQAERLAAYWDRMTVVQANIPRQIKP